MVLSTAKMPVFATDMDGTFLGADHRIPPSVMEAYYKARLQGVMVCLSTGRSMQGARTCVHKIAPEFAKNFSFFPGVYCHGGVVYGDNEKDVVYTEYMEPEQVRELLEDLYALKKKYAHKVPNSYYVVTLYGINGCVIDYENEAFLNEFVLPYEEWHNSMTGRDFIDLPADEFADAVNGVTHVSVTTTNEVINLTREYFAEKHASRKLPDGKEEVKVLIPIPEQLHFIPRSLNKAKGLEALAKRYGWTSEDIVAIGDGDNDLEMLQWAKVGVAMGNAAAKVKSVANHTTATNAEDGWAKAAELYVLGTD